MTRIQQVGAGVAIVAILAALGVGIYARARDSNTPGASEMYTPPAEPARAPTVVVHVAGAVGAPGVYELPIGSRTGDAVRAAGGFTAQADTSAVNLAAPLEDGQKISVPFRQAEPLTSLPAPTSGGRQGPALVNLNQATAEQLESLPGIGPGLAARIIEHRRTHGPFMAVDELAEVPGIGPKRLADLRPCVTTR